MGDATQALQPGKSWVYAITTQKTSIYPKTTFQSRAGAPGWAGSWEEYPERWKTSSQLSSGMLGGSSSRPTSTGVGGGSAASTS